MRERIVAAEVDAVVRAVLHLQQHSVIILSTTVHDNCEPSNFLFERGVGETQFAAILCISGRRAGPAWSNSEIDSFAVEETVAVCVSHTRNIDRPIEG